MDSQDFAKKFGTEKQCLDFLNKLRWSDGFRCPRCQHIKAWTINEDIHKYKCQGCGYQTSVLAGTIFHDSQKLITNWFRAVWYISSQIGSTSALGLKNELGLGSYRTAWTWLQKLRQAMIYSERDKLQGIVAVDEFPFASNSVLIAVEINGNKIGRIRMSATRNASSETIPFIESTVISESVIVCDGSNKYRKLSDKGYKLKTDKTADKKIGKGYYRQLPCVLEVLTYINDKKLLGTLARTYRSEHISYYLDECCFKFNRRGRQKVWFHELLKNAVQVQPIPNKSFVKEDKDN